MTGVGRCILHVIKDCTKKSGAIAVLDHHKNTNGRSLAAVEVCFACNL